MATVEENILHSLKKNGFPDKQVTLPFQAIFKACKKAEINMSDVLNKLKEQDVVSVVKGDRIHFYTPEFEKTSESSDNWEGFDFSNKMVKDAMDRISEMDPADLEGLKKQVENMTPQERDELMKRAKELFKDPKTE